MTDEFSPTEIDPAKLLEADIADEQEQVIEPLQERALREGNEPGSLFADLLFGMFFGVILVKSEVISWFRIQEMFRFDAFHMYGIIGGAVAVGAISILIIKRFKLKTVHGEPILIFPKKWESGINYIVGGLLFGFGWALLGACPGPIYALLGAGVTVIVVAFASALAGTWVYGYVKPHLPH